MNIVKFQDDNITLEFLDNLPINYDPDNYDDFHIIDGDDFILISTDLNNEYVHSFKSHIEVEEYLLNNPSLTRVIHYFKRSISKLNYFEEFKPILNISGW